jgi:hypothetical protein
MQQVHAQQQQQQVQMQVVAITVAIITSTRRLLRRMRLPSKRFYKRRAL